MKIGIIGFGKIGKIRYNTLITLGQTVSHIYETNLDIEVPLDAIRSNSIDDIINSDVDVIIVCTPNNFNAQYTIKSLEAGKHVFCEKPPALNSDEIREVQKAEVASNRKLMYGFNHRHHRSIKKIKDLIDSNLYGDVVWIRGRYGKTVDVNYFDDWRCDINKSGGGILIDQGIHMLDLFLYLTGNFDEVHSFTSHKYWNKNIEDNVFMILKNNKTNVTADLHSTMANWRHLFSLEILLTNGYIVVNGLKTPSGSYGNEELTISNKNECPNTTEEIKYVYSIDDSWKSEMSYFIDCINNDMPIANGNSQDALAVMNIIDEVYKNDKERY